MNIYSKIKLKIETDKHQSLRFQLYWTGYSRKTSQTLQTWSISAVNVSATWRTFCCSPTSQILRSAY